MYQGARNISFHGKFYICTKWMIPKNRPIIVSKLMFLTLWKFNYMIQCKQIIFSCQSIEFIVIKFQMGTPSHIELTSKSLIRIWWHKLWKFFVFLFLYFYFMEIDIFKLSFIEQANEKRPRIINRSISNKHWLLLLLFGEQF